VHFYLCSGSFHVHIIEPSFFFPQQILWTSSFFVSQ
jgi:hypothetical protein